MLTPYSPNALTKLRNDHLSDFQIIETDSGYYAVQMVSTFDESATQTKKESIVNERKNTLYQEKCAELEEQHSFDVKDDVLAQLTFDRVYKLNTETTTE